LLYPHTNRSYKANFSFLKFSSFFCLSMMEFMMAIRTEHLALVKFALYFAPSFYSTPNCKIFLTGIQVMEH